MTSLIVICSKLWANFSFKETNKSRNKPICYKISPEAFVTSRSSQGSLRIFYQADSLDVSTLNNCRGSHIGGQEQSREDALLRVSLFERRTKSLGSSSSNSCEAIIIMPGNNNDQIVYADFRIRWASFLAMPKQLRIFGALNFG